MGWGWGGPIHWQHLSLLRKQLSGLKVREQATRQRRSRRCCVGLDNFITVQSLRSFKLDAKGCRVFLFYFIGFAFRRHVLSSLLRAKMLPGFLDLVWFTLLIFLLWPDACSILSTMLCCAWNVYCLTVGAGVFLYSKDQVH